MKLFKFTKRMNAAINNTDGRITKVNGDPEITAEEKAAQEKLAAQCEVARQYLKARDKCALTSNTFKYVPSINTNIKATMRNFVLETMPAGSEQIYDFLFKA